MSTSCWPRTCLEQTLLQGKVVIWGWFALLSGRPPVLLNPEVPTSHGVQERTKIFCNPSERQWMEWCSCTHPHSTIYDALCVTTFIFKIGTIAALTSTTMSIFLCDGCSEKCLTTLNGQREIAEIICCRDMNINSISVAFTLIMDWTGCFIYLVQSKKLPDKKRDGRKLGNSFDRMGWTKECWGI